MQNSINARKTMIADAVTDVINPQRYTLIRNLINDCMSYIILNINLQNELNMRNIHTA